MAVIGVLVLLILLVGGAVYMIYSSARHLIVEEPSDEDPQETNDLVVASTNDDTVGTQPVEPVETNQVVDTSPTQQTEVVGTTTGVDTQKAETVTSPPPVQPPVTPPVTPPVEPVMEPVEWPLLTLEGVVGKGDTGSARLNGRVVFVGDLIEGVRVIAIHPNKAELEYKGRRMMLRVDSSTR